MEAPEFKDIPAARVVGGPRVISISNAEESAAVIASGADELLAGSRAKAGGWSGPGGRSAGSGIALRKFDAPTTGSEGILGLLPARIASAPARRAGGGRGSDTRGPSPPRAARPPPARDAAAPVSCIPVSLRGKAGTSGDAARDSSGKGLPAARSSRRLLADVEPPESSSAAGIDLDKYTSGAAASRAPVQGRRADSAGDAPVAIRVASAGARTPAAARASARESPAAAAAPVRAQPKPSRRAASGGAATPVESEEVVVPARTGTCWHTGAARMCCV